MEKVESQRHSEMKGEENIYVFSLLSCAVVCSSALSRSSNCLLACCCATVGFRARVRARVRVRVRVRVKVRATVKVRVTVRFRIKLRVGIGTAC